MKARLSIILFSAIEILTGILLLVDPVGFTTLIIQVLGAALAVFGVLEAVRYFRTPAVEAGKSLSAGILSVMFGLWCVCRGEWFLTLFPLLTTLYGVGVLASGAVRIQWAVDMLRLKIGHWGLMAASALLTMLCALVILANPFASTAVLWMFTGVTMILEAVISAVAAVFKMAGAAGNPSEEP